MEPIQCHHFHTDVYQFIKLASEDNLPAGALEKFAQLIQQTPTLLTHDERKQLIALGRKVQNSSRTLIGKLNNLVTSMFYPTIYGNPKFAEIVDLVKRADKIGKAAEAPQPKGHHPKPRVSQEIGALLPKEFPYASLQKNRDFIKNVLCKKIQPEEITSFLAYLKNETIPFSRSQLSALNQALQDPTHPCYQSRALQEVIHLGRNLEKVFGERLAERENDLARKSGVLWECIDRERNETGGFTYHFRLKDEYNDTITAADSAEKAREAKKIYDKVYPAVELPGTFLAYLDPEKSIDEAAEVMSQGSAQFYSDGVSASTVRIFRLMKIKEELNELGYVLSQDRGGISGTYLALPDRETLMMRWEKMREQKKELPPFEIHSSKGIAGNVPFVEAFFTHDVLLSSGKEFVHDQLGHILPTLHFILNPINPHFQKSKEKNEFSFAQERFRLVQLVAVEYRDLQIAKEGIKAGFVTFGVTQEQAYAYIEQMEALLGSIVDTVTNRDNAADTKNLTSQGSLWNLTLASPEWLSYFKDERRSGIKNFDEIALSKFAHAMKSYVQVVLKARTTKNRT